MIDVERHNREYRRNIVIWWIAMAIMTFGPYIISAILSFFD